MLSVTGPRNGSRVWVAKGGRLAVGGLKGGGFGLVFQPQVTDWMSFQVLGSGRLLVLYSVTSLEWSIPRGQSLVWHQVSPSAVPLVPCRRWWRARGRMCWVSSRGCAACWQRRSSSCCRSWRKRSWRSCPACAKVLRGSASKARSWQPSSQSLRAAASCQRWVYCR